MAQFQHFDCFIEDLFLGKHDFVKDDIRAFLTNEVPRKEYQLRSTIKGLKPNRNYKEKKLKLSLETTVDNVLLWCKSFRWVRRYKDVIGPFRYVVIYNATTGRLLNFYDYGYSLLLNTRNDKSFGVDFTKVNEIGEVVPNYFISIDRYIPNPLHVDD